MTGMTEDASGKCWTMLMTDSVHAHPRAFIVQPEHVQMVKMESKAILVAIVFSGIWGAFNSQKFSPKN